MQTGTGVPPFLQAGDSISWRRELPDFSALDGWVLNYRLINAAASIDIVCEADGASHLVRIPATASAGYEPGDYTVTEFVTRGTDRHTLGTYTTKVLVDLAAQPAGFDARTDSQRALDDLRAALRRWLSSQGHVQEYDIAGRRMRFASAAEIEGRIRMAEREVQRDKDAVRIAAGGASGKRILVRF